MISLSPSLDYKCYESIEPLTFSLHFHRDAHHLTKWTVYCEYLFKYVEHIDEKINVYTQNF